LSRRISPKTWWFDSIANRACGFRARIGRSAATMSSERRSASSATIRPSTVSPRTESSVPGNASTREPLDANFDCRRARGTAAVACLPSKEDLNHSYFGLLDQIDEIVPLWASETRWR
jgi:hypothetical protein